MKYLILGASAAGINAAKTIRELDPRGEITIVSKDNHVYSRCMLHHIIGEKRSIEEIDFSEKDFWLSCNIAWKKGRLAKKLIIEEKTVLLDNGESLPYDKLLIATGSSSLIPPIKNLKEGKGVYGLRNIEDALQIKEEAKKIKDVVVLGGGLVGIDAVVGLLEQDVNISLIEMADKILPLQLDQYTSSKYEKAFKSRGVGIYTGGKVAEVVLDQENKIKAVKLEDETLITCDMIIVAAGVKANTNFIEENTIKVDRGIVINSRCETNIKDIYAAGDVCGKNPIWPLAVKQGIVAAHNMFGEIAEMDDFFGARNAMNFFGIATVSIGYTNAPDESYEVFIQKDKDNYKKIVYKEGIIYGAILQGDIDYSGVLTYLIKNKVDISRINKDIFEINYSDFFSIKENNEYQYVV
ncbi:nitrite reductase [NAD(P)H] [Clostridium aceticum]|uniref:Nitrite reductase [NAD(P)H] n=1 Tax=Clostridium aceticum TaxID=84022 RepID=A0A0D8ICG0_9CLOT|nr:FAD-dependent oxidoreductase [Clostridium aceticum]AKL95071.1 nitrite reductase [NAD(P)H] [Clostridium aceticum]KJF27958.1 nitrate reductase [Clostridium aceticum]